MEKFDPTELVRQAGLEAYYEVVRENRRWNLPVLSWDIVKKCMVRTDPFTIKLPEEEKAPKN